MADKKIQLHLTRPKDRTLESYKSWIRGLIERINPEQKRGQLTEEEWKKAHAEFWAKVDAAENK